MTSSYQLAGVIGYPVGHSRSPYMHRAWLQQHQIHGDYVALPIAPHDIHSVVPQLPKAGFIGCNVTIPHKETVMEMVDVLDPVAERVGAVNTLVFKEETIYGYNTDVYGFLKGLEQGAPDYTIGTGVAVVVGAGGVARAALVALQEAGYTDIRIVNRTVEKAEALSETLNLNATVYPITAMEDAFEGASLLINATSLGMESAIGCDWPLNILNNCSVVYDLVYIPLMTPLLQKAKASGHQSVNGLPMLVYQGAQSFARWFGIDPEIKPELFYHLKEDIKAACGS